MDEKDLLKKTKKLENELPNKQIELLTKDKKEKNKKMKRSVMIEQIRQMLLLVRKIHVMKEKVRREMLKMKRINLTEIINYPEMENFKKLCREISKPSFKDKKLVFYPKVEPKLFGTFSNQLICWRIKSKGEQDCLIRKYNSISTTNKKDISNSDPNHSSLIASYEDKNVWKKSVFKMLKNMTINELKRRLLVFDEEKAWKILNTFQFYQDFCQFIKIADKQIAKYKIKGMKIIQNPIFGFKYKEILIGADGDLILNGKLVEIKCSKKPNLIPQYIRQLVGYWVLNELLPENKQNLVQSFIYWNPFYDIFFEFHVENIKEIQQTFKTDLDKIISKTT